MNINLAAEHGNFIKYSNSKNGYQRLMKILNGNDVSQFFNHSLIIHQEHLLKIKNTLVWHTEKQIPNWPKKNNWIKDSTIKFNNR